MRCPRFVYFDLGNVLIHFSHARAVEQLAGLANVDQGMIRELVFDSQLQAEYERGQVSTKQFCDRLREATKCTATNEQLCLAASDIFWANVSVLPLLVSLCNANVPMGILSNTCEAHWQFLIEKYAFLVDLFPHRILSFEVKANKPESEIYRRAAELANCDIGELFFVDDLAANVAGARQAGLEAVLFDSSAALERQLRERGVSF